MEKVKLKYLKTIRFYNFILPLILIILSVELCYSQTFQWGKRAGGTMEEFSEYVTSDAQGFAYITGKFSGSASFENTTINSTGLADFYVAKYSPSGNLVWLKQAGSFSPVGKIFGKALDVSLNGDIYVTGYFDSIINFGNGITISANGNAYDMFIAKYNSSGIIQWAVKCGGIEQDYVDDIAVDNAGNIYITGQFRSTSQFGAFSINSAGSTDVFIAKLNSSGVFQWVKKGGGSGFDAAYGITLDAGGNIYITGSFNNTALFGNTQFNTTGNAAFVMKYNSNGNELIGTQSSGNIDGVWPNDIHVTIQGEIYICGFYYQNAQFGSTQISSSGNKDCFIAKLNNLFFWQWAKSSGGTQNDIYESLSISQNGILYITGMFQQTANFGGTILTSTGGQDAVIARYNLNGDVMWAIAPIGAGSDYGKGVSSENGGHVYFTGQYSGSISFPGNITLSGYGLSDIYLVRMDTNIVPVSSNNNQVPESFELFQNYPNPFNPSTTISFNLPVKSFVSLKIYDVTGRKVSENINSDLSAGNHSVTFNGDDLASGIYYYRLESSGYVAVKKMLLIK